MVLEWLRGPSKGTPERKRQQERRARRRIVQYFDCWWSSAYGEERARISNISPTGCYIESRFSVPEQGTELADFTVSLPTGSLILPATVITTTPGVGFAVRFARLDPQTLDFLKRLTDTTPVEP
jgi:PilZ domain-containing protein